MTSPIALPGAISQGAISPEALAELPIRRYEGQVRLVATPRERALAMADIHQEGVVGVDTETRPAFKKGESHLPCLVQVATARAVYLFQLPRLDCSEGLAELFSDPGIVKVGVALAHDLRQLQLVFPFQAAAVLDLGVAARRHGIHQTGLRNLAGILLGIRIPKGARTSNWAAPHLTPAQINYAATDAWIGRELYLCMAGLGWVAAG